MVQNIKTLVILAAGLGSRYGGDKQIDPFGPNGETIMDYSIYDAIKAGFKKIILIIRKDLSQRIRQTIQDKWKDKISISYALQGKDTFLPADCLFPERLKPWGTAHAVLCIQEHIDNDTPFAVINADDFYGQKTFQLASRSMDEGKVGPHTAVCILYPIEKTLSKHGSVNRGVCSITDNKIKEIVEVFDITREETGRIYSQKTPHTILTPQTLVSMNFWIFHPRILKTIRQSFRAFLQDYDLAANREFLLPNCINSYIKEGELTVYAGIAQELWFGVTYQKDAPFVKAHIEKLIRQRIYSPNL